MEPVIYTGKDTTEKPDAVIPHTRICLGAARAPGRPAKTISTGEIARMLNSKYINSLKEGLDGGRFSRGDFELSFPESGNVYAEIVFAHNKVMYFKIKKLVERDTFIQKSIIETFGQTEHKSVNTAYQVIMSPGEHEKVEVVRIARLGDAFAYIPKWCEFIYDELEHSKPGSAWIDQVRSQAAGSINFDIPEDEVSDYFNDEELSKIHSALSELEAKFEKLNEKNEITQRELDLVRSELASYRESSEVMTKGVWAKVTKNKIVDLMISIAKTKEGRQLIVDGLKKLLNGG